MLRGVLAGHLAAVALATAISFGAAARAVDASPTSAVRLATAQHQSSSPKAHAAFDVPSFVCGLLKKPIATAVSDLISLVTDGRIKGTVAGTIFAEVGFKPFCIGQLQDLEQLFKRTLARPSLPNRVRYAMEGPLATNVYMTRSSNLVAGIGWYSEVYWHQYDPSAQIVGRTIMVSENGGRYVFVTHLPMLIFSGDTARFAIQLRDAYGRLSPWAYSPLYRL